MSGQTVPALMPKTTVDDLYRTDGLAELIGGRIVCFPAIDYKPVCIVAEIVFILYHHARQMGQGEVGTTQPPKPLPATDPTRRLIPLPSIEAKRVMPNLPSLVGEYPLMTSLPEFIGDLSCQTNA